MKTVSDVLLIPVRSAVYIVQNVLYYTGLGCKETLLLY